MTQKPAPGPGSAEAVRSWTVALLVAMFFLGTSLYIASRRLFWFDEISTVLIARLADVPTMWKALVAGGDLLPLPYYVIVRASEAIFGQSEMAARLPSTLALVIGLIAVFDCARRFTNGTYGLVAQGAITCSFFPFYGYEARPYGILFMISALLLWTWVRDGSGKWTIGAFAALMFFGTLVHYYAVLCLIPFAAWDLLRIRRPSLKLFAGSMGAGIALALLAPQILVGRRSGTPAFWANPSLSKLQFTLPEFFPAGLFLLALLILTVTILTPRTVRVAPASDAERVSWLFLLIPFAGFALAAFVTHAFTSRYMVGTFPGIAVGFACLLYRQFGEQRFLSYGIAALFLVFAIAHQISKLRYPELIQPPLVFVDHQAKTKTLLAWEDRFQQDGKSYTALPYNELVWMEAWYYSKHKERYVAVARVTLQHPLAKYYPLPKFWSFKELKDRARESAIVTSLPADVRNLFDPNESLSVRATEELQAFYVK